MHYYTPISLLSIESRVQLQHTPPSERERQPVSPGSPPGSWLSPVALESHHWLSSVYEPLPTYIYTHTLPLLQLMHTIACLLFARPTLSPVYQFLPINGKKFSSNIQVRYWALCTVTVSAEKLFKSYNVSGQKTICMPLIKFDCRCMQCRIGTVHIVWLT